MLNSCRDRPIAAGDHAGRVVIRVRILICRYLDFLEFLLASRFSKPCMLLNRTDTHEHENSESEDPEADAAQNEVHANFSYL